MDIEQLHEQIRFLNDRIDRQANELAALRSISMAFINAHPDPSSLASAIERERERFLANGYATMTPDADLETIRRLLDQALASALSRVRAG